MTTLDQEIAAYDKMRDDLENQHMGEWVLFFGETLIGVYASFDEAAKYGVQEFGSGPYLIRQVGAPPVTMPTSVVFTFMPSTKVGLITFRATSEGACTNNANLDGLMGAQGPGVA
jgi:hypothetical protein